MDREELIASVPREAMTRSQSLPVQPLNLAGSFLSPLSFAAKRKWDTRQQKKLLFPNPRPCGRVWY